MAWKHEFMELPQRGITIHYVDEGPQDRPTLLLLHGWPDCWFGWRHQIKYLAQSYRVIAPDLRGFGQSSVPTGVEAYGSKNVTDDLAALLDALDIDKVIVIGHDWGGAMAWRMCLYYPDRVQAVCGICTPYLPPAPVYVDLDTVISIYPQFDYQKRLGDGGTTARQLDMHPKRFLSAIFRRFHELAGSSLHSVCDIIDGAVSNAPDEAFRSHSDLLSDDELEYYVQMYRQSGFQGPCSYYATRAIDFETEKHLARTIDQPALFIGAANDAVLHPSMAKNMPEYIPNLQMKIVEDAGHWILWEQTDIVNTMLMQWLQGLPEMSTASASKL